MPTLDILPFMREPVWLINKPKTVGGGQLPLSVKEKQWECQFLANLGKTSKT